MTESQFGGHESTSRYCKWLTEKDADTKATIKELVRKANEAKKTDDATAKDAEEADAASAAKIKSPKAVANLKTTVEPNVLKMFCLQNIS